ncbi:MAG TPA: response regulator [Anaerolineales bacterium]|nr:response regulator [Anaerolineales bacterium]
MVGRKILIVDENKASLNFLSTELRGRGFTVFEAPSGREALIAAWRDQPDLILFDPVLTDIRDDEFILKLRGDIRTRNIALIALSSDPGPSRRETCTQAGVDEYIVKSPQALSSLDEILDRIFTTPPPQEIATSEAIQQSQLIVFLSAKGGTGTSSLCANVAMNIKQGQPNARVAVVDLVLPIGSIGPIVGYEGDLHIVSISDLPASQTHGEYFHENLPRPELWQFQLLAGSPDPHKGNALNGERVRQVLEVLRSAYDYVILDIGRSLSRISLPLIQQADLIALIVATDHSTVKLTRTVYEYLQSQGVDSRKIYAILNRAVGLEGVTKKEAEEMIGLQIKTMMPYMGSNFSLANNLNQPITVKYPTDTASIVLRELAVDVVKTSRLFHPAESS